MVDIAIGLAITATLSADYLYLAGKTAMKK